MDKNKNYYKILGVSHDSTKKEIKKKYYKLSFKYHPDKNPDTDKDLYNNIIEAYKILSNEDKRTEYDKKSRWGKDYNEYYEFFDVDFEIDWDNSKSNLEKFKQNEVNNIQIEVDSEFDGNLEYKRWIRCKKCEGTGKDFSAKIEIKDNNGDVIKTFEPDDGCDFCDGSGKDKFNNPCQFCGGKGKTGLYNCKTCNGKGRILGKQKIKNIKLTGEETKLDSMGHWNKGNTGYLLIVKKDN